MVSYSNLRKNRFAIIFFLLMLFLAYLFIRQKERENKHKIEQIEKTKITVPPSIYQNIKKLKEKLYHLEFDNNARTQELLTLRRKLKEHFSENTTEDSYLSLPSIYNYLPHLLGHKDALSPIIQHAKRKDRKPSTLAFGIPTVRRNKQSYLMKTLESMIHGLTQEEKEDVLLIVFIGERNSEYIHEIYATIKQKYLKELDSGLIEVIAPPPNYYPDLDHLAPTFGDSKDRVKWRAKQNLDYAFLMMYAQSRSMFYVQMEDDLMATPSYASTIKAFAIQQSSQWFMIEFSSLGFIGKLFKAADLSLLVEFFLMFYKEKPNDWLLDHIFWVRMCNPEKDSKHCNKEKAKLRIKFKPSLFQHIGKESSLKGKKQTLVDKEFKKQALFHSHLNPKALIKTDLEEYQTFTAKRGYLGHTFLWAVAPVKDSVLRMIFIEPEKIEKFFFKSGNVEHPADKLINATVEVLTKAKQDKYGKNIVGDSKSLRGPYKDEDYARVGDFNSMGIVSGVIPKSFGVIVEMRIRVLHNVVGNWVIISEFNLMKTKT